MSLLTWQFRISRLLGRLAIRVAAVLTLERMPPFLSTSALVVDGERVLAVIDPVRKETILPGGFVKWRESPEDAMIREVWEETGYRVRVGRLLGVYSGEEWAGEPGVVRVIYNASIEGGQLASSAEGEATWASLRDLADTSTRDAPLVRLWISGEANA